MRAGGATVFVDGARLPRIDFEAINRAALPHLESLCARWLPGGRKQGREWRCGDLRGGPGRSCCVNLETGKWADFAAGAAGGDVISLTAAIHNLSQAEAAQRLATMLGIDLGGRHV
jgi:putative DNA primase/helicase